MSLQRIAEIQKEITMLEEDEKYWSYCLNDPKTITTPLIRDSLQHIKEKIPWLKAEIAVIEKEKEDERAIQIKLECEY